MYNKSMKKEIVFYLAHQFGDILGSKQLVRYIVEQLGNSYEFYYIHRHHPDSVNFHEKVKVINLPFNIHFIPMYQVEQNLKSQGQFKDALFLNLWVGNLKGSREFFDNNGQQYYIVPDVFGNYKFSPDTHINGDIIWQSKISNQIIDEINDYLVSLFSTKTLKYPTINDLITKWNSDYLKKDDAENLLSDCSKYKLKVLICNSDTKSGQRENFSYENYLRDTISKYKDVSFIFTNKLENIESDNVFYLDNYVSAPNLEAVEYISAFMDILTSSMSGPGQSVLNDRVLFDNTKTLIYIKKKLIGCYYDQGNCKTIQSDDFSKENIVKIISENIEEKLK